MGRLLREKEILPYTRGTGENWNVTYSADTNKIAKYGGGFTFNNLAWSFTSSTNKLVKEDDFTKKTTKITFINPSTNDGGRDGNWAIGDSFSMPLASAATFPTFIGSTTYNSSIIFKPEYYGYCDAVDYPVNVTTYNSSGSGTAISVSDYVGTSSPGCSYEIPNERNVLGMKAYFLKYGDNFGKPKLPWDYLEYENESDIDFFYDFAQTSNLIFSKSCLKGSYWPDNWSFTTSPISGANFYDGRDTAHATRNIPIHGSISLGNNVFYTGNYDLMCLELAVMDVDHPEFTYETMYGYVNVSSDINTALKPCISPLAPNVSLSAELLCISKGKLNISPCKIITNLPSKGYINDLDHLYAFVSDDSLSPMEHAIWSTVNIYGLFYIIPLIADNPYIYYPSTDVFAKSNNVMGLYFHTAEAGEPLNYNNFKIKT